MGGFLVGQGSLRIWALWLPFVGDELQDTGLAVCLMKDIQN